MAQRIGLYGGSFNPIHFGHLIIARAAAEALGLDRLIFLPSASPPHKHASDLADPQHRAEMVRLAIDAEPLLSFSDHDLMCTGPSYTVDTVAHFRQRFGDAARLFWLIGADSLADLPSWRRVSDLVDACAIATAVRAGCGSIDWAPLGAKLTADQLAGVQAGVLETPTIDISSTGIRERVRDRRSIRFLTPEPVRRYIDKHGLYA